MATEADIRAALDKGNRAGLWEAVGYILDSGSSIFTPDHGTLPGLADDDHTQYLLLAGRSGQTVTDEITINGGSGATPGLLLQNSAVPRFELYESGEVADNTRLQIVTSGGNLFVTAYADDRLSSANLIRGLRNGVGWDSFEVDAHTNFNSNNIDEVASLLMEEAAAVPNAPTAGQGTWWVRNDAPNVPMFTDDAGTDHVLRFLDDVPTLEEVLTAGDDANGQLIQGLASLADNSVTPASSGFIRTGNNVNIIYAKDAGGTDTRLLLFDSNDDLIIGEATNVDNVQVYAASQIDMQADVDMNTNSLLNAGYVEVDQLGNVVDAVVDIKSDSGESAGINIYSGANRAWVIRKTTSAFAPLQFDAYDTATNAFIDTPIGITRTAGGDINFARQLDMQVNPVVNVSYIDWDGTVPSDGETRMPAQSDGYFRDADNTANLRHFDLGTDETDVITHGANQDVPIRAESSITRDEQASHVGTEWEGIPGGTGVATGLALLQDADGTWQACASGYSYEVEIWFEAQDSPDSTTVTHGKYVAWISFVAGDEAHVKDQGWTAPSNSVLQSNLFPTATVVASNIAQIIPRRASGEGNDWDILARVKHRRAAVTTGSQE